MTVLLPKECCLKMKQSRSDTYTSYEPSWKLNPYRGWYYLFDEHGAQFTDMNFCPWCGSQLETEAVEL